MEYATSAHSCCCGCGEEVVTPFTPTDWKMTYNGETISLHPSIGNWMLKCRSHYVIRQGMVIEAGPWSQEQVEAECRRDRAAKRRFYRSSVQEQKNVELSPDKTSKTGFWVNIRNWLNRCW
nr:DUF6527 family protein [uncultured Cohaesibacter sp.]